VGLTKGVMVSLLAFSVVDCGFDSVVDCEFDQRECGRLWNDDVCYELDQHACWIFSASSLKQHTIILLSYSLMLRL
jgi:hypothetical protein